MHNIQYKREIKLPNRNEGKLKNYESCLDVRAWSHDCGVRDQYLREWMKCDMTHCVLPVNVVSSLLVIMAARRRPRPVPRCQPDCKSKYILDSICNSCDAMRECLKNEQSCAKMFQEEEFETSPWPCERCLEALKNIKMFWKIIIEKVFHLKYVLKCKDEESVISQCSSVRNITAAWQREMIGQAARVNLASSRGAGECCDRHKARLDRVLSPTCVTCRSYCSSKAAKPVTSSDNATSMSYAGFYQIVKPECRTQYTQTNVQKADVACNSSFTDKDAVVSLKTDLFFLQQKFDAQECCLAEVTQENELLKATLHNKYVIGNGDRYYCRSQNGSKKCSAERGLDQSIRINPINTDSEMVITMKNCKCKCFRQVSLLQVIHKTNNNVAENSETDKPCYKKEDPLALLKKVQNTFETIVEREINLALNKKKLSRNVTASAESFRICKCKSSCRCRISESSTTTGTTNFSSANEESEGKHKHCCNK